MPRRDARATEERRRCAWAQSDPLLRSYHDREWGVPVYDSRALWEMLVLEGFQAGLSWLTVLRRRQAFREAFAGFDPRIVASFGAADIRRLLNDEGIIRSRAKIEAAIGGARIYLQMEAAGEDFAPFIWGMAGGKPIRRLRRSARDIPAKTPLSEKLSKELKNRGFKFVGPVIVYAWMQATGIVDDHVAECFRHRGGRP